MKILFNRVVVLLAITAISIGSFIPASGADVQYDLFKYLPLMFNNVTVYKDALTGQETKTETILSYTINLHGADVFIDEYDNGTRQYVSKNSEGMFLHGLRTIADDGYGPYFQDIIFDAPLMSSPQYMQVGDVFQDQTTFNLPSGGYEFPSVYTVQTSLNEVVDLQISESIILKNVLKFTRTETMEVDLSIVGGGVVSQSGTSTQWCMKNIGVVKMVYEDEDENVVTEIIKSAVNYYDSGNVMSEFLAAPDEKGYIYYERMDENVFPGNRGKKTKAVKTDGSYVLYTEYWETTGAYKTKEFYNSDGALTDTCEHYESGNLERKTLVQADGNNNLIYEYLDEDFYGDDYGRLSKIIKEDGSYEVFVEYWDNDKVKIKQLYDPGNILKETLEYHESGRLQAKVLSEEDPSGNIRYEYYDEDFLDRGYGRYSKIIKADGSYEIFDEYWNDVTEQVKVKLLYDAEGNLTEALYYDFSGNLLPGTADPYYHSSDSWGQGFEDLWGLKRMDMENAWGLSTGEGVTVAVIDTGVYYDHIDINDNMWINEAEFNGQDGVDDDGNGYIDDFYGWDFYGYDNTPTDVYGHGTHVAGIVAAEDSNNEGIVGAAYNAEVMSLKIANGRTTFTTNERIAEAIIYAADMGAKVINCSFGLSYSIPVINAFQYAYDLGCIIVASAGNHSFFDDPTINRYPALLDYVITVGASNYSDERASFSNYGDPIDVVAPGEEILSLRAPTESTGGAVVEEDYLVLDGTSMAAPYVSGLAALMLSQDPTITFDDIMRRLKFSSVDLGSSGWDRYYGYGRIDAFKALSNDWYASGAIKTWWLSDPDETRAIRYDYYETGEVLSKELNEPDEQGLIIFNYDLLSRIKKKIFQDDRFVLVDYWSDTTNMYKEKYFDGSGTWQKTIEYWENFPNVIHCQWVTDPSLENGDVVYYEHDQSGKVIKQKCDNADFILTDYWQASEDKRRDRFFGDGWVWQKTIEYWQEYPNVVHLQWVPDSSQEVGDVVYYQHDEQGRVIKQKCDNADFILTDYWASSEDKRKDRYFGNGWVWQKTIEYWGGYSGTMRYQWVVDTDASGEIVYFEYDEAGRLKKQKFDNADFILTDYWASSEDKRKDRYFGDGWVWQQTTEYWEDYPNEEKCKHFSDSDPDNTGDIIYEAYDTSGNLLYSKYDDGHVEYPGEGEVFQAELPVSLNQEVLNKIDVETQKTGLYTFDNGATLSQEISGEGVQKDLIYNN